ncbi:MAG: helix-turn-helix domain-containing protein, partial [Clostridia bacterium]
LAFDTFEEMVGLETWLRENFLKWLPENILLLIAGRHSLKKGWLLSPLWRNKILYIPVEHLNQEETVDYLSRCGIEKEELREQMWLQSLGHPLTLSLTVASQMAGKVITPGAGADWFDEIAAIWLKEATSKELRKWVEVAAMLRHFNQELLSYLLDEEIASELFDQLTGLSFVRKSDRGWKFHDLMREATCRLLRQRTPNYYKFLVERCALYYADAILEKSGKTSVNWEVTEFFHYVEDSTLRAIRHFAVNEMFYWEPLTDSTIPDAEAYLEEMIRLKNSCDLTRFDPDSGVEIKINLTAEESIYLIQDLNVQTFHELDSRCVQLLRSKEGKVVALAVLVPLHVGTLPHLEEDPIMGPFLAHLTNAERKLLESPPDQPAGWFMRALHYVDLVDPTLIGEGIKLMFSYMCTRGIFVVTPQPVKSVEQLFLSMGFEMFPGVTHSHYDGKTPTPYFIIDTRGDKLHRFLNRLMNQADIDSSTVLQQKAVYVQQEKKSTFLEQMTSREQDVSALVLDGYSNAEIANKLFISEVTVKKHLSAVFAKLGVKNRSQLIGKLLNGENAETR